MASSGNEIRVVMVGKTGCGKSCLGNSILNKEKTNYFESKTSGGSVTNECKRGFRELEDGRCLMVIDTPGLFDTSIPNEECIKEITKCIALSSPGPHIFIFVLSIMRVSNPEVKITLEILKKAFGPEVMKYVIVVFTAKDNLVNEDETIDDFVRECPPYLRNLLAECKNHYVSICNKIKDPSHESDVADVINLILKTIHKNSQEFFSQEMLEEKILKREEEKRMKEEMEKSEMERKYQQSARNEFGKFGQLAGMMVLMMKAGINLSRRFNQFSTSTKTLLLIQLLICIGGNVSSHYPISQCIGSTLVINPNNIARGEEFYLADITRTLPPKGLVIFWINSKITNKASDRVKYLHHESYHNLSFMITNLHRSDDGWYRMDVVLTRDNLYITHKFLLEIYDCDTEKPTTVLEIEEDTKQQLPESGNNTNQHVEPNEDEKIEFEINPGDQVEEIQNIGSKLGITTNMLLLIVGLLGPDFTVC